MSAAQSAAIRRLPVASEQMQAMWGVSQRVGGQQSRGAASKAASALSYAEGATVTRSNIVTAYLCKQFGNILIYVVEVIETLVTGVPKEAGQHDRFA